MACRGFRYFSIIALCATVFANSSQGSHEDDHSKSLHDSSACTRKYTIVDGDTCDKISARQHVSTYVQQLTPSHQLAHTNKKINEGCTNLIIGDVLCLGLKGQDCTKVYVVKEGDICSSVAKRAGIPLGVLFKNNPNINKGCTNIYPEEVSLSLHKGVLCVAPAANSTTGIKGSFHPPTFPPRIPSGIPGQENTPFRLPPINLTESSAHLRNSTHNPFNVSAIPSFLNSSGFPIFNQTNSSFPASGTPNFVLPPPLHLNRTRTPPFPSFNLTDSDSDSFKSSISATGSTTSADYNPNPTIPPFGGLNPPDFVPGLFPTPSGSLGGFGGTTTTTTSTTTTLGFSVSSSASARDGAFGNALAGSPFPFPTISSSDFNAPPMPFK
ncbi:hypothetical protein CVT25_011831 [Psilocybe cyanescens]|uniref:LysM domain-containing protein n=1 Tax=Psilocybe cyanescens TaxID=93625 RepID=A0A409WJ70_PSICY|nr:hypothetical protein CVT25_011831 [Psilocybe cyanescens]